MREVKENVFTRDIFFEKEKRGFSAVNKKKKRTQKVEVDSTEQASKNYGNSVGSSQNIVGDDFRYKGDLKVNRNTTADNLVSYLETLPYLMSGMQIVLKEKLELWNPKGKGFDDQAKKCISMLKWERDELVKELSKWKG